MACCTLALAAQNDAIRVNYKGARPTISDFAWAYLSDAVIDDDGCFDESTNAIKQAWIRHRKGLAPEQGKLTVDENLRMGAYELKDKAQIAKNIEMVYGIFPRLGERAKQLASTMSGGEQQMLAIARALMLNPKMLLIDEVSMGLMPIMVNTCFDVIKQLNDEGITVLVVEQNANKALKIADRGYVLETGNIVISDTAENMRKDDTVQKAYLGG